MASVIAGLFKKVTSGGTPSAAETGGSYVQGILKSGFPVGWAGLLVLAGIIPIAPFSFLGYAGVNLMVTGSIAWAAVKAAVQGACVMASLMIKAYYPGYWFWAMILTFNPWYIYDIVQLFNPAFPTEGFKIPFIGKAIGRTTATLNIGVIAAMVAILSAGGYSLLEYIPPEFVASAKPALQMIFTIIGGGTALAGGGIGAYMMLPSLMSSLSSSSSQVGTAFLKASVPAVPAAPAPTIPKLSGLPPKVSGPAVSNPSGPAVSNLSGPAIPNLSGPAVSNLSGPAVPKVVAPAPPGLQRGGAIDLDEIARDMMETNVSSYVYLSALAIAAIGGLSLAAARSRSENQT